MKKIIVCLMTIALVLNGFIGVSFATPIVAHNVYVALNDNQYTYQKGAVATTISGNILSSSSNALFKADAMLHIYKDNGDGVLQAGTLDNLVTSVRAEDGVFSVQVFTSTAQLGLGEYFIVGTSSSSDTGYTHENEFEFSHLSGLPAYDMFTIMYGIKLVNPVEFKFTYPVTGQVSILGKFVNGDVSPTDTLTIEYLENPFLSTVATHSVLNDTEFGFLFNGNELNKTGEIGLFVNGVLAIKGMVEPANLDMSLTPLTAKRLVEATDFRAVFNFSNDDIDTTYNCMAPGYEVRYQIFDNENTVILSDKLIGYTPVDTDRLFTDIDNQTKDFSLELGGYVTGPLNPGNYKIEFEFYNDPLNLVMAKKSFNIKLNDYDKYNLVNWVIEEKPIGMIKFQLPTGPYFMPTIDPPDQQIAVAFVDDMGVPHLHTWLELSVEGCGINETIKAFDESGFLPMYLSSDCELNVTPKHTGTLNVLINVYEDKDSTNPIKTFSKSIKITGWNTEISDSEVVINDKKNIIFKITNENNEPINNAIVEVGNTVVANGTLSSITNGTYIYENDSENLFNSIAVLPVKFWTPNNYANKALGAQPTITINDGIKVVGNTVYNVTSPLTSLINGVTDTIALTVKDIDGYTVYGNYWRIDVNDKGEYSPPIAIATTELGEYVDLDGIAGNEARELYLTPNTDQKQMIIRVTNSDQTEVGEIAFNVIKPQINFINDTAITENFNSKITCMVTDPRSNSVLSNELLLVDNSPYYVWSGVNNWVLNAEQNTKEHSITLKEILWQEAKESNEEVVLDLFMVGDTGDNVLLNHIPVKEAQIVTDPQRIIIGTSQNLLITCTTANDKPIINKEIYVDDELVNTTNENGEVVYVNNYTNTGYITIKLKTDVTNKYSTKKVAKIVDTEKPKVTIIENENNYSAQIIVTDNTKLARIRINNEEQNIFAPLKEYTYLLSDLKPGTNTVTIEAIDIYDQYLIANYNINMPNKLSLTLTVGVETGYGLPVIKGSTTMVPLRLAEQLGATVYWDSSTSTATYTLGDREISVSLNSKRALVNGVEETLPVAPYLNTLSRTMVPLRMIAQALGYEVNWYGNDKPIVIK